MVPITYIPNFIKNHEEVFQELWTTLDWVHIGNTPRLEYYSNDFGVPYTYGSGNGVRTYLSQPWTPTMRGIRHKLEDMAGVFFEACFINGYRDGSDQLGWHADDSPEMDDDRPIGIISLGARREIFFRPQNNKDDVTKQWLDSGSLCLMDAGMQDTHYHRIPKSSVHNCGPRVSLTFRGFIQ